MLKTSFLASVVSFLCFCAKLALYMLRNARGFTWGIMRKCWWALCVSDEQKTIEIDTKK